MLFSLSDSAILFVSVLCPVIDFCELPVPYVFVGLNPHETQFIKPVLIVA